MTLSTKAWKALARLLRQNVRRLSKFEGRGQKAARQLPFASEKRPTGLLLYMGLILDALIELMRGRPTDLRFMYVHLFEI